MANLNVSVWYTDSTQWTAVSAWIQNHGYTCGQLVRQLATPAVGSERVFVCGVAGTTNNVGEPTWAITRYGATTDGTVTWYECTGNPATNGDLTNALTWTQQHASSTAVTTGLVIYDTTSASLQICTTAGTISGSSPVFSATAGVVTSDGATVKWTSLGLASGFQYWKAPFARLQSAVASTWMPSGTVAVNSIGYLGNDHAETQAAAETITVPVWSQFISVDHTANLPPTSANLLTGASITTTGANALTVTGAFNAPWYMYGITLSAGSGATNVVLTINNAGDNIVRLDSCALVKAGTTGVGNAITLGNVSSYIELNNTTMQFGATADGILLAAGKTIWRNTVSAIQGATIPTTLFAFNATYGGVGLFEGVDFSAITGTLLNPGNNNWNAQFVDCKFNSALTYFGSTTSLASTYKFISSGSSGVTYDQRSYTWNGSHVPSTTVVRNGGAVAGTTPISWQITTTANVGWTVPFTCPGSWLYNSKTGATVNVNVYGIWFGAALPTNIQIWHDTEYFGSTSSPLGSIGSGTRSNILAASSNWTADTSAWDSAASAWISNHAYTVGAIISGTSVDGYGRVFICTQSGTSTNGSPPAAFASAVDGGSVTDNGAKWQAGWRFKMTVPLTSPTPQLVGYLYTYLKAALPSSTFYIDPQIVLN